MDGGSKGRKSMNSFKMIALVLVVLSTFGCQSKQNDPNANKRYGQTISCPDPKLANVTFVMCQQPHIAELCPDACATVSGIEIQNTSPFITVVCDDLDENCHCRAATYLAPGETRSVTINSRLPEFKFYTHN